MKKEHGVLMTSGNIPLRILAFSIPLMLGNLFQLLYSTVDTVVVGQFVGKTAVAAIGTSTPIVDLIISFFMGLSSGASVVVSRYYGAKRPSDVKRTIHTFICFGLIFGSILSVFGVFASRIILTYMDTPASVLPLANSYLTIYFSGCLFQCIYNSGNSILQATGDSKHPLYFLVISSIINIILDLLFVVVFKMAVRGVALATIISQCISALLILYTLSHMDESMALNFKELKIEGHYLRRILRIGVPASLQSIVISFSNVIIQTHVNSFGESSIAAFTSSFKLNEYVALPGRCIGMGVTTFAGQNLGAREYKRVTHGVYWGIALCALSITLLGIPMISFGHFFMGFFTSDAEVIAIGVRLMKVMIPGYILFTSYIVLSGALRASGRSFVTMLISIFCFTLLRQVFLSVMMPIYKDMVIVGLCYTFSWTVSFTVCTIYYIASKWIQKDALKSI